MEIFGYEAFKFNCTDESLYKNKFLTNSIDALICLPKDNTNNEDSASFGPILTSVGHDYSDITIMPGAGKLIDWITEQILQVYKGTSVKYTKTWVNKMYRNSHVLCHKHPHKSKPEHIDFVAVFYINVPQDGSNLVFVRDGKPGTFHFIYKKEDQKVIECNTGDLIVHSPELIHAVTINNGFQPRICLAFEGQIVK
jgi:hypothetical protein